MGKLKKQQLTELREVVGEIRNLKVSLAETQMAIMDADSKLQQLRSQVRAKESEFKEYTAKLEEELGDVQIDLTTGEYK